jgi:2-deoxy-D-gluconate 3-dehydrogenase
MALALQEAGAKVVVSGRDREQNKIVATELSDAEASVLDLDVRDEAAVEQTIAEIVARLGRLDVLVNNAGVVREGLTTEIGREDWEAVIATDLTGPFLCARHAARAMITRGEGGKIINIASIYSLLGTPRHASYAAAKAGLLGLTRGMAMELAPHSIQVNAILPGFFETDMTSGMSPQRRREITHRTPAGRWGTPDDLAGVAILLASHASDYITGACLVVDGGFTISPR